ncbi:LysR family transcriptional regulator [Pseudoalteromonas sp. SMS1]|uniref:LysR family transcriptional regulator n=1 Tax=Pseudoalteromonas sp. SMS1 TaxID=2908894 RepID=UPI001F39F280|nr:LysR family transcriptional regulator [Pseudoalteromonas sp. SMS1]MCF2859880.1 LysR family transcriptional regulator [Pseudoalteromonas sp. SMS1]
MELYHLKSFVMVAKEQNLTKAAKRLCTTPPAVSAHIKALEQELDVTLFERTSKGMRLTPHGIALQEKAQVTLNSANELVATAGQLAPILAGKLTLGLNLSTRVLGCDKLLAQIHRANPQVSIALLPSNTSEILNQIEKGCLDGGYVYGLSGDEFESYFIANRMITTVIPKTWLEAQHDEQALLVQKPWIGAGKSCPFDNALKDKLPSAHISHLSSFNEWTRMELVAQGLGMSFVDESEVELLPHAVHRTRRLDFELPLYFVVKKSRLNEPLIKALCLQVEKLSKEVT